MGYSRSAYRRTRHAGWLGRAPIVETIVEREESADLVVIGKRGASADFAKGHLGTKVERVVRQSIRPVLVASRAYVDTKTILVAFDGGASARKALTFVATSPLLSGLRVLLATREGSHVAIFDGKPEEVIASQIATPGAQMLVMGAYGHSPLRAMIVDSTTTEMVRSCAVPVFFPVTRVRLVL